MIRIAHTHMDSSPAHILVHDIAMQSNECSTKRRRENNRSSSGHKKSKRKTSRTEIPWKNFASASVPVPASAPAPLGGCLTFCQIASNRMGSILLLLLLLLCLGCKIWTTLMERDFGFLHGQCQKPSKNLTKNNNKRRTPIRKTKISTAQVQENICCSAEIDLAGHCQGMFGKRPVDR